MSTVNSMTREILDARLKGRKEKNKVEVFRQGINCHHIQDRVAHRSMTRKGDLEGEMKIIKKRLQK